MADLKDYLKKRAAETGTAGLTLDPNADKDASKVNQHPIIAPRSKPALTTRTKYGLIPLKLSLFLRAKPSLMSRKNRMEI
jgi:hypothetical protein